MKTGIIYIAINKINGKSYIGQTIQKLKERTRNHFRDAKRKNHTYKFANALRKYNQEDWEWNIIYENVPFNLLGKTEELCISLYDTYKNGYNSTLGGEYNPMHSSDSIKKNALARTGKPRPDVAEKNRQGRGKKLSKEHKKKVSDNHSKHFLGKKHSDETKAKMFKAKKNYVPWNKGKAHSEETKKKMKEAWKRRKENIKKL